MLLGIMAPLGWIALRLILFSDGSSALLDQAVADITATEQSRFLYAYMCVGTMLVLGTFGFFIGRASQQIHDRAVRLDQLNREVAEQKRGFERRFTDLDQSIKNFHVINADLQSSVNRAEVLRLSADGLHEVIGFDRVNVLMLDDSCQQLEFVASRGINLDGELPDLKLPLDERAGCLYRAIIDRRVMLIDDITTMGAEYHLQPPCDGLPQLRSRNFILCPIVLHNRAIGVLAVDNKFKHQRLNDSDVDTVKLFADQISSSLMRINLLDAVDSLTQQLEHTFNEFLKYRVEHDELVDALRQATNSTSTATSDISGGAGVVQEALQATRSAVGEISVSIDQVSGNLKALNEFMEGTIASTTEIQYTVDAVEENTVRSQEMAQTVRQRAEHGVDTVHGVLGGMDGIKLAVVDAEGVIGQLSAKGEEVGSITSVVTELTRKTSLLALNAAIIAAQAGEHGRSFAVVADEVRSLADEAAVSTGRINQIVAEIQGFTHDAVDHIHSTHRLVDEGVVQGNEMAEVLSQILESSQQAMEMANDIRRSTREISQSVSGVNSSVEELGEMSAQLSRASREEAAGARNIVASVEEVRSMTEEMVGATDRQTENTRWIEESVERVSVMARRIFDEMDERRLGSLQVIEELRKLKAKKE
jgi:methyl-accepting chemotaxis protein